MRESRGKPTQRDASIVRELSGADGCNLVTVESYRKPTEDRLRAKPWHRHRLTIVDFVLVVSIIVAALLVRWPFIAVGDTMLNPDEAIVGVMALDIAAGDQFPIYFYGQRYMGSLESIIIAGFLQVFDNPLYALRMGPTFVFGLFVAVQFLMLTRWFGRFGGLVGALSLLAASPMFMHWSISARGGYVEILLWGTALMWAYSEWFLPKTTGPDIAGTLSPTRRQRFLMGFLVGSGLWINPSIGFFAIPIILHSLLNRPLMAIQTHARFGLALGGLRRIFGRTTLPIVVLTASLVFSCIWGVWVDNGTVKQQLLLGLLPAFVAGGILLLAAAAIALFVLKRTNWLDEARTITMRNAALILGALLGAIPSFIYAIQTALGQRAMEPSLPMGLRPLWQIGDSIVYLLAGLPTLFAADARPFLALMGIGRPWAYRPLDIVLSSAASSANHIVIGGLIAIVAILLISRRKSIASVLRLEPSLRSPQMLLIIAFATTIALYLFGGCTMNYSTVRYLVPLWAFVPGLLAAACVAKGFRRPAIIATIAICAAWGIGQFAMHKQLGNPHPLRSLATSLEVRGIQAGIAEPLDAHLLSFMTQGRCRLAEFESFWVRFRHHRDLIDPEAPVNYIVDTGTFNWTLDLQRANWKGEPPPESQRFLWRKLRAALVQEPDLLISRTPLAGTYELFRLRHPIPERDKSDI